MLRPATPGDLLAILAIRDNAGDAPLSDPGRVTEALARHLIEAGAVWVWQAPAEPLAGFAAIDRAEGRIVALLVTPGHEGRGIGRALLSLACDALRAEGHPVATIALEPVTAAARHYLRAGWTETASSAEDVLLLRKLL